MLARQYLKSLPRGEGFLWLFRIVLNSSLCCISKSMRSCFFPTTMIAFNWCLVNHTAKEIIYDASRLVAKRLPIGHSQKLWNFLNLIMAKSRPNLMTIRQQISSQKSELSLQRSELWKKQIISTVISGIHFEASAWHLVLPSILGISFMQISQRATETVS